MQEQGRFLALLSGGTTMKEGEGATMATALHPGPRGSSDETAGATRTRSRTKAITIGSRTRNARFGDRRFHSRRRPVASDEEDVGGTAIVPWVLLRLSATPGHIEHLCPRVDQQADEVLSDLPGIEGTPRW